MEAFIPHSLLGRLSWTIIILVARLFEQNMLFVHATIPPSARIPVVLSVPISDPLPLHVAEMPWSAIPPMTIGELLLQAEEKNVI
jgi:hypothetical protein